MSNAFLQRVKFRFVTCKKLLTRFQFGNKLTKMNSDGSQSRIMSGEKVKLYDLYNFSPPYLLCVLILCSSSSQVTNSGGKPSYGSKSSSSNTSTSKRGPRPGRQSYSSQFRDAEAQGRCCLPIFLKMIFILIFSHCVFSRQSVHQLVDI